jgi:hypothetical protein
MNILENVLTIASLGVFSGVVSAVLSVYLQIHLKQKAELKTELRELELKWVELIKEYHQQYFRGEFPSDLYQKIDSCQTKIWILEKNKKTLAAMSAVLICFPGQDSEEYEELQLLQDHPDFYHDEFWKGIDKVCKLIKR